jgi:hypothetical protein
MAIDRKRTALICGLLLSLGSNAALAQQTAPSDEDRRRIEQKLDELNALKADLDARIDALQAEVRTLTRQPARAEVDNLPPAATPPPQIEIVTPPTPAPPQQAGATANKQDGSGLLGTWGAYEPGKGFVLLRNRTGEVSLSLIAYIRYLNQLGLDPTYTDSFGRTKTLDRRQDVFLNKVNLSFKGWLFDPDFTYRIWIWTNQPAMGQTAQVVVGGQMGYSFGDALNIYAGVAPLPSTRSTNWSYPFWLKMDNRTMADEFFRGSYTFGYWADGSFWRNFGYRIMIANNLSALGVDAGQLDSDFGTVSGALWWMPTTGEFGPALGFGDYEYHEKFATLLGVHYTRSREDSQSQPNTDEAENTQIRLSDGTQIFQPGAFGTDGQIRKATYQMLDLNAGFKYRGWSLEGEYYFRWVGDFQTVGIIPVTSLFDHGFQLQASTMLLRDRLQLYASGSKLFGQYGSPWDFTFGFNLYPFLRREMHINMQGIYMKNSPVGGLSYPYQVGGNGWIFNTDIIVTF